MRKKLIAGLVLALAVPSLALAAKPNPPGKSTQPHGKAAPKVMYVLKGTLSNYTAATDAQHPGMVTLLVKHSNRHGAALKNTSIVFVIDYAKTKVKIGQKRTTITNGDTGVVKLRALKNMDQTTFNNTFPAAPAVGPTALMVIDQKMAPTP
jgi:ribosomal protein L35AE/L33A